MVYALCHCDRLKSVSDESHIFWGRIVCNDGCMKKALKKDQRSPRARAEMTMTIDDLQRIALSYGLTVYISEPSIDIAEAAE